MALLLSELTGKKISYLAHTPADLFAAIKSGQIVLPDDREKTYSDSGLEWLQEVYDGRLDSLAVTTNTVMKSKS